MQACTHEDFFDEWMKRQSDLVQATALAFGEREVLEACVRALEQVGDLVGRCQWGRRSAGDAASCCLALFLYTPLAMKSGLMLCLSCSPPLFMHCRLQHLSERFWAR